MAKITITRLDCTQEIDASELPAFEEAGWVAAAAPPQAMAAAAPLPEEGAHSEFPRPEPEADKPARVAKRAGTHKAKPRKGSK